jgi:phosphatidylglycerol:prolipoprotein diacylglycerol transferase
MVDVSLLTAAAFLVTLGLAVGLAARERLDPLVMFWTGVAGIAGALAGGYAVGLGVAAAGSGPGGNSTFGAFLGAGLGAFAALKWGAAPAATYLDAAVPAVALGYAVARVGCFVNGDDFGVVTSIPWAVTFPRGTDAFAHHVASGSIPDTALVSLPVHPTQLYQAAVGLALFAILVRWQPARPGDRLTVALFAYGVARFVLEFLRGDSEPLVGGLHANHLLSLVAVTVAVLSWARSQVRATVGECA